MPSKRVLDKRDPVPGTGKSKAIPPADLAALGDEELVAGIVCGSEEHFNQLYDRYFRRVYGFVYNRSGNRADVEEIVQETFTAVFESIGNFRAQSSLLSWIFGIARNTANNSLRRDKVRDERIGQTEPEFVQAIHSMANCSPEEQLHMRRFADELCERLNSIADWQYEIFVMRHVDDLSIGEICDRTHRSSDAVRSSLYRVKDLLVRAAGSSGSEAPGRRSDAAEGGVS